MRIQWALQPSQIFLSSPFSFSFLILLMAPWVGLSTSCIWGVVFLWWSQALPSPPPQRLHHASLLGSRCCRGELARSRQVVPWAVLLAMFCEETLHFLLHWILNLPNTSLRVNQISAHTSADLMQPLSTAITFEQHGAFLQVGSAISGTVALTFITVSVEPFFKLFGDPISGRVQVGLFSGHGLKKLRL